MNNWTRAEILYELGRTLLSLAFVLMVSAFCYMGDAFTGSDCGMEECPPDRCLGEWREDCGHDEHKPASCREAE